MRRRRLKRDSVTLGASWWPASDTWQRRAAARRRAVTYKGGKTRRRTPARKGGTANRPPPARTVYAMALCVCVYTGVLSCMWWRGQTRVSLALSPHNSEHTLTQFLCVFFWGGDIRLNVVSRHQILRLPAVKWEAGRTSLRRKNTRL